MALSAEGIDWPTSAWLHNPLRSAGSLLKHQWNLFVYTVCEEYGGAFTQKQLDYLT